MLFAHTVETKKYMEIDIPFNWSPRDYQKPLWKALQTYKRAIYVWHRRAGKDLLGLNFLIKSAILDTPGTYWHVFPTYNQGKKAIWTETDINGRKYLDYIPKELIASKNDQEMKIKFFNGYGTLQIDKKKKNIGSLSCYLSLLLFI